MIRRISEKVALMLVSALYNGDEIRAVVNMDGLHENPDDEILISPEGIKLRCKPLSLNPNHYEWILLGYQEDQSDILAALERLDPSALESVAGESGYYYDDSHLWVFVKGPFLSGRAWTYRYSKTSLGWRLIGKTPI